MTVYSIIKSNQINQLNPDGFCNSPSTQYHGDQPPSPIAIVPESILHECQAWQLSAFLGNEAAEFIHITSLAFGDVVLDVEIGFRKGDVYMMIPGYHIQYWEFLECSATHGTSTKIKSDIGLKPCDL